MESLLIFTSAGRQGLHHASLDLVCLDHAECEGNNFGVQAAAQLVVRSPEERIQIGFLDGREGQYRGRRDQLQRKRSGSGTPFRWQMGAFAANSPLRRAYLR